MSSCSEEKSRGGGKKEFFLFYVLAQHLTSREMSKPSVVRQPFSFFFVLFCKYVFKKRSYSRILYYELNVLLLPVDSLNISMFRFPLRKRIYIDIYIYICMYEKAFG